MQQQNIPTEKRSPIRLAYWELQIALRSGGIRIALVLFALLLLVALTLGVIRTQERQNDVRLVELENAQVKELFVSVLQGKTDTAGETEATPTRLTRLSKQLRMSAKSPYLVSHADNLWDVSLFPSPLSVLSVGASQSWPDHYRVNGVSFSETIQRNEQVRAVASFYGPFDVAFVIMAIAPLIIIGLSFNVSSGDRESGLQNLTVAQTGRLGKLMAVRCFVRAALVIGLVVGLVNGTLLITFGTQFDGNVVANLIIWNVLTVLYLFFWSAMCLFVNSFARSSATNGTALLLFWSLLVMVIPGFVSHAVQEAVPTLPESELVDRAKGLFDEASKDTGDIVERYQVDHPEVEIDLEDEQQMALVNYLLAHDAAGNLAVDSVNSHFSANSLRAKNLDLCAWVSPAISFRNQTDRCSGNSEAAFIAFSAHAANTQAKVAKVFLHPSIANEQCTAETIAALPEFQESAIPKTFSKLRSFQSIASVLVWLIVLVGLGIGQFRARALNKKQKRLPQRSGVESA